MGVQSKSREFLNELAGMTKSYKENNATTRKGAFGTTTRVQPRFQKGKDHQYDQIVNQRVNNEVTNLKKVFTFRSLF